MGAPSVFALAATGTALLICLITDLKKKEISPWVCAALVVVTSFDPGKDYVLSIVSALIGFLPLYISALIGHGGGGDALLSGALGYALQIMFALYTFLFASVLYALVLAVVVIITKEKKKQLPYVPFLTAGWAITLLIYVLEGRIV